MHRQAGVGLIEVLISILIASFGLLGLAGLQVASLRYQKVAQFRSTASQYTADIADRMRANVAGAKAGNYVTPTGDKLGDNATATACTAGCDAAKVAAQDIYNWRLGLARAMAGGWGEISGDITNGFVITVYFKEPGKPTDASGSLDTKCRAAALDASKDKDVRCFTTTFLP
ncbi:type IV pilus modification protein PilV [Herminiimonas sp. CN]|uniref:type IV pilus modification protein PilV n=1 Tax=Herminiimonas sp. CN TaxID=1349818 RepID=UPI0004734EF3|nr:type IV pilus modification protein PilV [Herminiimonas sp. CN]